VTLRPRCSTRWSGCCACSTSPATGPYWPRWSSREVLWRLITGPPGATVRQLGLADSSLSHVSRAVRWIREHYAESFRVEDVTRLSGISVSAFHRSFQAVTAMSPIQFQKQIRLQEARLLLATHPGDVTGVGRLVGYDNASQFSREHRRRFGAPPSQDAALCAGAYAHLQVPFPEPAGQRTRSASPGP
jgi:AraC-like DNA-binding protein